MERRPCENQDTCRLAETKRGCFEDIHHKVYPKRDYTTELEKEYREMDIKKVLGCRAIHNDEHATTLPPPKPSVEQMREEVNAERVRLVLNGEALI